MLKIVGPYPPPYGGVSLHISRLVPYLMEAGIEYRVFNQYLFEDSNQNIETTGKSFLWWATFLFKRQKGLVHFHQFSSLHFPYLFLFTRFNTRNVILTIHNENILNSGTIYRKLVTWFLKHTTLRKLIVVSASLAGHLGRSKIDNVIRLPAYVPPKFFKNSAGGKSQTVFFNIWKLVTKHSVEKYGLDLLIRLAVAKPEFTFLIYISVDENLDLITDLISANELNNVELRIGRNLSDDLGEARLLIRPNREDGYGVSIQEALDCDVPVIASDVCQRPPGAHLFSSGEFDDLFSVFESVTQMANKVALQGRSKTNYHERLIELYQECLSDSFSATWH